MAFSRPQCFFGLLLIVNFENDPGQMKRCAVIAFDNAGTGPHPMTTFVRSAYPILNIQVAAGLDRLHHGEFGALAILRFK